MYNESSSARAIGGAGMGGFIPPEIAGSIAEFTQSQKAAVAVVREVHQRMRRIQWKQASVTSLHPWSLTARHGSTALEIKMSGVLIEHNEVTPLIELSDGRKLAYVQHIYPTYQVATRPTESGDYTASEILPLELACDFIQQHQGAARPDEGGLFAYEGTKTPAQELERYNELVSRHGFKPEDEDIVDEYLVLYQSKVYEEQLGRKSETVLPELSKLQETLFKSLIRCVWPAFRSAQLATLPTCSALPSEKPCGWRTRAKSRTTRIASKSATNWPPIRTSARCAALLAMTSRWRSCSKFGE